MKDKKIVLGVASTIDLENFDYVTQVISINYLSNDFNGDYIKVTTQTGSIVNSIQISTDEAISLGFIDVEKIKQYIK